MPLAPPGLAALGGLVIVSAAAVAALFPRPLLKALETGQGQPKVPNLFVPSVLAGLAAGAASAAVGGWAVGTALGAAAAVLTSMALIDLRRMVIPDVHVAMLAVLALVGPLAPPLATAALGALVGGGLLWAVRWAFMRLRGVEPLGLGDVKLMAALGALCGPRSVLWVIVAASAAGATWGLVRNRGRIEGAPALPFGAFAALPAAAALALGKLDGLV